LRCDAPIGGGPDWPGYEALADHARNAAPAMVKQGLATPEELAVETLADRLRQEVVGQQGVLRCLPAVGIWARRQANGERSQAT
jgi:hypothetical protein